MKTVLLALICTLVISCSLTQRNPQSQMYYDAVVTGYKVQHRYYSNRFMQDKYTMVVKYYRGGFRTTYEDVEVRDTISYKIGDTIQFPVRR